MLVNASTAIEGLSGSVRVARAMQCGQPRRRDVAKAAAAFLTVSVPVKFLGL